MSKIPNRLSCRDNQLSCLVFVSGKYCLDPPLPPGQHALVLDPAYSPAAPRMVGQSVMYTCDTVAVAGTTHWNRRLDTFTSTFHLQCGDDNTWAEPAWPTCVPSECKNLKKA